MLSSPRKKNVSFLMWIRWIFCSWLDQKWMVQFMRLHSKRPSRILWLIFVVYSFFYEYFAWEFTPNKATDQKMRAHLKKICSILSMNVIYKFGLVSWVWMQNVWTGFNSLTSFVCFNSAQFSVRSVCFAYRFTAINCFQFQHINV